MFPWNPQIREQSKKTSPNIHSTNITSDKTFNKHLGSKHPVCTYSIGHLIQQAFPRAGGNYFPVSSYTRWALSHYLHRLAFSSSLMTSTPTNWHTHTHTHINARLSQRPRKVIRLSSGAVQLQTQYPSGCKHIPPCTVNKYIYAYAGAFYCTRALSSRESVREQVSNSLQRARV